MRGRSSAAWRRGSSWCGRSRPAPPSGTTRTSRPPPARDFSSSTLVRSAGCRDRRQWAPRSVTSCASGTLRRSLSTPTTDGWRLRARSGPAPTYTRSSSMMTASSPRSCRICGSWTPPGTSPSTRRVSCRTSAGVTCTRRLPTSWCRASPRSPCRAAAAWPRKTGAVARRRRCRASRTASRWRSRCTSPTPCASATRRRFSCR